MSNSDSAKSIFLSAIENHEPADWPEFLDNACRGNGPLREKVEELLRGHERMGSFHDNAQRFVRTESVSPEMTGKQVGPYHIREQIGEGGMGVVYVAEQTEPVQRKVALKIIKPGMDTKEVIARFEAERQALAFMEHPNIARVLDAGATESGRSYFVMELVRGIPITEYCDQAKLPPRIRLELFKTVCDAVQHAHQKGIIHRDIKPSNVLVTQVSAKPVVKVIDFGLAKAISGQHLTKKTLYTGFMKLMGTPVYMSPEQAGLSGLDIDTRSDVYSLGILLYELLTGTTPLDRTEIQKKAYEDLCKQIREVEAPKPSSRLSTLKDAERSTIAEQRQIEPKNLRQLLDGDLDVVVLKALEKDRDRRYVTPQDLAEDIDRFLNDQPVLAVPASQWYLARKYFHRHRLAILTALAVAASLIVATIFSTWQAVRATSAEQVAVAAEQNALESERLAAAARDEAEAIAKERRRLLYAANMQLADQLWNRPSGRQRRIEELLTAWIPVDDSQEDLRDFAWRYQWTRLHHSAAVTVRETSGATLSSEGHLITADAKGLTEWDAAGVAPTLRWSGDASQVTLSPDGRWAAIHFGEIISLIDIAAGDAVLEIPHDRCAFSAGSNFIAAWTANVDIASLAPGDEAVSVWKLTDEVPFRVEPLAIQRMRTLPANASRLQLADDGRSFLIRGGWNPAFLSYVQVAAILQEQPDPVSWRHTNVVSSCTISPNGKLIASGSGTGMVHVRLRSNLVEKLVIGMHGGSVKALSFSPSGTELAAGGSDGSIDIWDITALHELSQLPGPKAQAAQPSGGSGHGSDVTRPRLAPSAHTPRLLRTIKAHLHAIRSLTFSSDGAILASFDSDGVSKRWNWHRVDGRYEVKNMGGELLDGYVAFSFENQNGGVVVKEVTPQQEIVSGSIQAGDKITGISNDPNGPVKDFAGMDTNDLIRFVGGGAHNSLFRLRIEGPGQGERHVQLRRSVKLRPRSMQVAFAPDGKTLAIAGQQTGATSLNIATGKTQRFHAFGGSVAISPDGKMLAVDDWYEVLLWDLQLKRDHARLECRVAADPIPHNAIGGNLAFSPDGKYLAVGTGYRYANVPRSDVKVWDLSNLEEIGEPIFKNDCTVSAVAFTPLGSPPRLIAADTSGVIRIWDTSTWTLERTMDRGSRLYSIAISPDGRILATGGNERIVLWDFQAGTILRVLNQKSAAALAFSPDGRALVSGNFDKNVVVWDVASGRQLRTFDPHTDSVFGVSFSPDGNTLATIGSEGVLRLWEAAPLEKIDRYPETLDSLFRLGQLRHEQQRYGEAEAILRRLLQLQEKQLPTDHEDIVQTRAELESAIRDKGGPPGKPPP